MCSSDLDGLPADFVPGNYCPPFEEPNKPLMQSRGYWPCQHTSAVTPEQWRKTCQHYWAYCTYLDALMGEVERVVGERG